MEDISSHQIFDDLRQCFVLMMAGDPMCDDNGWWRLWYSIREDISTKELISFYKDAVDASKHQKSGEFRIDKYFKEHQNTLEEIYMDCSLMIRDIFWGNPTKITEA